MATLRSHLKMTGESLKKSMSRTMWTAKRKPEMLPPNRSQENLPIIFNRRRRIRRAEKKITEIKAQYPVIEGQEPKKGLKKSVSKNAGLNGPIVRWESQRNKRQV